MDAIDESVHVVEYSDSWPAAFESERDRILSAVDVRYEQLAHIGSTAIPGLAAKPIIDIMLGVDTYPPSKHLVTQMIGLGYEALGEAGVSERLYFRCRGLRAVNLHVVRLAGRHWLSNCALREYLRASDAARRRYSAVKQAAITSGATHLLAYSEAKASVLATLVDEAVAYQANQTMERTR